MSKQYNNQLIQEALRHYSDELRLIGREAVGDHLRWLCDNFSDRDAHWIIEAMRDWLTQPNCPLEGDKLYEAIDIWNHYNIINYRNINQTIEDFKHERRNSFLS